MPPGLRMRMVSFRGLALVPAWLAVKPLSFMNMKSNSPSWKGKVCCRRSCCTKRQFMPLALRSGAKGAMSRPVKLTLACPRDLK